jgi:hypothetical protein
MKLATKTTAHLFPMVLSVISRDMTLETIRLLPVNSSAPAMTTSIRPTLKAAPAKIFEKPRPHLAAVSKVTVVESSPPKPI